VHTFWIQEFNIEIKIGMARMAGHQGRAREGHWAAMGVEGTPMAAVTGERR